MSNTRHSKYYIDKDGQPRRALGHVGIHADVYRELERRLKKTGRKQMAPYVADILAQYIRLTRRQAAE